MSLFNTKPRYFPTAIATESGWINPITKEVLVSVGGLKSKLEAEAKLIKPTVIEAVPESIVDVLIPVIEEPEVVEPIKEEIVMNEEIVDVKTRKPYAPRKPKVIGEVTNSDVPAGTQLIAEVVEYDLDTSIVGE
jgi:hypothetical protein